MEQVAPGRCLCGAYQFEVRGSLGEVRLCHCDLCRQITGSAFSANCKVPLNKFALLTDRSTITEFQRSPGVRLAFCSVCGSPAYARVENDPHAIRLRLGTFDRLVQAEITAHVWAASMAAWDRISDDLPCHSEGIDGPQLDRS